MNSINLIIIFGPPASGKMTVGQALQKLTGYKLFYNHMSLELANQFFDFGTENFNHLDRKIRFDIFKAIEKSKIEGLIFTMVWAFNERADEEYLNSIIAVFKNRQPKVCLVELKCAFAERISRNRTANRLLHKPSKRDIHFSDKLLRKEDKLYRMNSLDGEFDEKKIWKIDNTNMEAKKVAEMIIAHYELK